jgi:predicted Zn-dependent protease
VRKIIKKLICYLYLIILGLNHLNVSATVEFKKDSFVSDAEVQFYIESWLKKLFEVANLKSSPKIYLLINSDINAASLSGSEFIVFTGLLQKAPNVKSLLGVLAHEVGHEAKAHHSCRIDDTKGSSVPMILSSLLGGAVAALSGNPEILMAGIALGSHIGERTYMKYSQSHENEADAFAFKLLKKLKWSSDCLTETFKMLDKISSGYTINPYTSSHPISADRLTKAKLIIQQNPYDATLPEKAEEWFERIQGKIDGFLLKPNEVKRKYSNNNSLRARYACAIAEYRSGNKQRAIEKIKQLLEQKPNDPFYFELLGQICFENGNIQEAKIYYEKAFENIKNYNITLSYITTLSAIESKENISRSEELLKQLVFEYKEASNDIVFWKLYSTISDKLGKSQQRDWCMAEIFLLQGDKKQAKRYAQKATNGNDQKVSKKAKDILSSPDD